jgi:hypothetical protein
MEFTPAHCRQTALLHGSLTVLRVMLVEARVDVRGLDLLAQAPAAATRGKLPAKNTEDNSSWVQRCKGAVKALLARGAIIGGGGTRSKLLRRLEQDGESLLRARILATLCETLPDVLLSHIGDFADIAAPYAWRECKWGVQSSKACLRPPEQF